MGKNGREKRRRERIQITLYIDNKEDREIFEYLSGSVNSSSAVGRELLLNAWRMSMNETIPKECKIKEILDEEPDIYNPNDPLRYDTVPRKLEIIFSEEIQQNHSLDDYCY
ncbi:hypothetical protein COJ46_22045 [Bacillus sp. AFS077874]|uniref:hypothetical protein n=1 Tax=Bacillus sp. AFS077874 TaxID=2033513 RepID=UPI000BF99885|nr:hypothetical protein [Bacillus sp. AFS077874]PFM75237.1 hypothetical protein COJ46_22045 [Bacillus sp. AFS077874]